MWLVNSISAAQEHFISNLIRQKIISEIDKQKIPTDKTNPIMLYLPEHDWHDIGLLFYQYLLRSKGLHTVYLGQSLPYESSVVG
jgi:methanogenic corrinoid protein MtbC1